MSYAEYQHRMRQLPPTTELAARLRDGLTLGQLAAELGMEHRGLANRLLAAGFMPTGETEKAYRHRLMREHLAATLRRWSEPWMGDAACSQVDPDLWFPEAGGSASDAKSICASCPVVADCLTYATTNKERFGIWGGRSELDRRKAKRRAA